MEQSNNLASKKDLKKINEQVIKIKKEHPKLDQKLRTGPKLTLSPINAMFDIQRKPIEQANRVEQMVNDWRDSMTIDQISDSRRRDPLNQAINERDDRIMAAMADGSFVDNREKEFLIHNATDFRSYEQARDDRDVHFELQQANNDIVRTDIDREKKLHDIELEAIQALSGKNEYGMDVEVSPNNLKNIKEKLEIVQALQKPAINQNPLGLEKPQLETQQQIDNNQRDLIRLQQQLKDEQNRIYNELEAEEASRSK